MKKSLLFTFAFIGAITFTFAQVVVTDAEDTESFTFGNKKDFNTGISEVTAGAGKVTDKNNWLALLSDGQGTVADPSSDDTKGNFTFDVATTSADLFANITINLQKRIANTVTGSVDVAGNQAAIISDLSVSDTISNRLEDISVFLPNVTLTSAAKTIKINMDQLLQGSQDAAGVPAFRLISMDVTKSVSTINLSVDDINGANNISISSNPVTDSFQLNNQQDIQTVKLFNTAGQLVKTYKEQASYNVTDVAAGVYFVNIETAIGSETIRVIKK